MCSSKFIAQFWRRRNTHQVECGIWMRLELQMSKDTVANNVALVCAINAVGRSLPATNVYFSTKEDGGSVDERGTT